MQQFSPTELEDIRSGRLPDVRRYMAVLAAAGNAEYASAARLGERPWWSRPSAWLDYQNARMERWFEASTFRGRWDALADIVLRQDVARFHQARWDRPRNHFHPRTLEYLEDLTDYVSSGEGKEINTYQAVRGIPQFTDRFTPEAVRERVRDEVGRRQRVAASSLLLVAETSEGVVVQHQASGLRARFTREHAGVGLVFSKPHRIASIDPSTDVITGQPASAWHEYAGLGIGARIYAHGAALMPEVRWRIAAVSDAASRLRARLHAEDPWRWESDRCSCRKSWPAFPHQAAAQAAEHTPTDRTGEPNNN